MLGVWGSLAVVVGGVAVAAAALLLLLLLQYFISLSIAGNSGRLTWVRHSKGSATHAYQCLQYFRVSTLWYGTTASAWDI